MFALIFASPVLATVNIIEVFIQCDPVGKVITIGLAVFSLVAWTVMFGKHFELKRLRELNHRFEAHLRDQRSLLELPESFRNQRTIPYADLFADAIESYWRAAAIGKEKGDDNMRARLEHAENALQRALARQTLRYESSMIFLASIVYLPSSYFSLLTSHLTAHSYKSSSFLRARASYGFNSRTFSKSALAPSMSPFCARVNPR